MKSILFAYMAGLASGAVPVFIYSAMLHHKFTKLEQEVKALPKKLANLV